MKAVLLQRCSNGLIATPLTGAAGPVDLSEAVVFPDDLTPYSSAANTMIMKLRDMLAPPAPPPPIAAELTAVRDLLGDVPAPLPEPATDNPAA